MEKKKEKKRKGGEGVGLKITRSSVSGEKKFRYER